MQTFKSKESPLYFSSSLPHRVNETPFHILQNYWDCIVEKVSSGAYEHREKSKQNQNYYSSLKFLHLLSNFNKTLEENKYTKII